MHTECTVDYLFPVSVNLIFLVVLQPTPVILLKEGTDTSQGIPQLVSNINACQVRGACPHVCLNLTTLLKHISGFLKNFLKENVLKALNGPVPSSAGDCWGCPDHPGTPGDGQTDGGQQRWGETNLKNGVFERRARVIPNVSTSPVSREGDHLQRRRHHPEAPGRSPPGGQDSGGHRSLPGRRGEPGVRRRRGCLWVLPKNLEPNLFFCVAPQVGDGTTSVTLLSAEFLKQLKPYVEEGLHPQTIIRAFRTATNLAVSKIKEIAISVKKDDKQWVFPPSPLSLSYSRVLNLFPPPQGAEAAAGEVRRHGSELQADRRPEGFLLQDGGGRRDVSGRADVPEDDRHQEGSGRSPRG